MTIWRMRIACWIAKSTNTHSDFVIFNVFTLQQWLYERVSMLRYTYVACLVPSKKHTSDRKNVKSGLEINPFSGVDNKVMKVVGVHKQELLYTQI